MLVPHVDRGPRDDFGYGLLEYTWRRKPILHFSNRLTTNTKKSSMVCHHVVVVVEVVVMLWRLDHIHRLSSSLSCISSNSNSNSLVMAWLRGGWTVRHRIKQQILIVLQMSIAILGSYSSSPFFLVMISNNSNNILP